MALRVLLADESTTIKKVFQLSLQDFAVDVIAVSSGLDVLAVAAKTRPDIIFADVILQKKSGYDVSLEIKKNAELKATPVVLIWSGFMELDAEKYKASLADAHLEKPFDTHRLRQLITTLVPKTKTNPLGPYLKFPKLPDFDETKNQPHPSAAPTPTLENVTAPESTDEVSGSWSMDFFEPPRVPTGDTQVHSNPELMANLTDDEGDNQWVQKTLSKYKLNPELPTENEGDGEFLKLDNDDIELPLEEELAPVQDIKNSNSALHQEASSELELADATDVVTFTAKPITSLSKSFSSTEVESKTPYGALTVEEIEKIIRTEAKETIEKVVWQILPEIATQVIEREIKKLLESSRSNSTLK